MLALTVPAWEFSFIRKSPRIRFVVPVEVLFERSVFTAQSQSLSVGGMLLEATCDLAPSTTVRVHFLLPTGFPVIAAAQVVYCRPGMHIGIEFTNLDSATQDALRESVNPKQTGQRRSIRIPERFFVELQWDEDGTPMEETAQTVLLSQHGCLLLSKTAPYPNARLQIRWPEMGTATSARVVSRQPGLDGLFKTALEFAEDTKFWGIDFEAEKTRAHMPNELTNGKQKLSTGLSMA